MNGSAKLWKQAKSLLTLWPTILTILNHNTRRTPNTEDKIDVINTFIVLSGDDMNNSIHRPERCLAAQGLRITSEEDNKN